MDAPESIRVSIVYLTYDGLSLVRETLPVLVRECGAIPVSVEIVVVDNGSRDGTGEYLADFDGGVRVVVLPENRGFAAGCNAGARRARGTHLFFINNDIRVRGDFLSPLLDLYESDPRVFAVGPRFVRWDGCTPDDGMRRPVFDRGLLSAELELPEPEEVRSMVFFLGAGVLISRSRFFELGGFDEIYTPFSWEDLDLGYRAVRRGYVNLFCPAVRLEHKREATTKTRFSSVYFKSTVWRNRFVFTWSNVTDTGILLEHAFALPLKLVKFLLNGRWPYVLGFFRALGMMPRIIRKRRIEKEYHVVPDKKLLDGTWKNEIKRTGRSHGNIDCHHKLERR
jgi:GT2 family glycosyltransferase